MTDRKNKMNDSFCAMPFVQLALRQNGDAIPCCMRRDYVLGNIKEHTLAEIWNSEKMKALRREFLNGKPTVCKEDIRLSQCNKWAKDFQDSVSPAETQNAPPIRFDLRLNGKCNLECIMCSEWKAPNGVYDTSGFWEEAPQTVFPYLKEIEVLGGEPFVQKDTYRLIDEISAVNPKCLWIFSTNAHWKFNDRVRASLDKIDIKEISVSIDSLNPETYSKIRVGGKLQLVLETLDDLRAYREERRANAKGFKIHVVTTLQTANYLEMFDFIEFCKKKHVHWTSLFLEMPLQHSLLSLDASKRDEILNYLIENYKKIETPALKRTVLRLLESLEPEAQLKYLVELQTV